MRITLTIITAIFCICLTLSAQEPPKPETVKNVTPTAAPESNTDGEKVADINSEDNYVRSQADAIALGPKNEAFMKEFTKFRELGKKLTALKIEYQDAKPDRQQVIDAEYPKLYQSGVELHKNLLKLAMEAHQEAPNRNLYVSNLLYSTVEWDFNRENYEEAVSIFRALLKGGIGQETEILYAFAGMAAFLTMNLDEAEKWITKAEENDNLTKAVKAIGQRGEKGKQNVQSLIAMLNKLPEFKVAWAREQEIRKAEQEAGEKDLNQKLPRVELETTKGKIVLEMFENEAPNTVANFVNLVEKGFYNGTPFHRVLPLFMAQGGDPTGTGTGGPGYTIDDECGPKYPNMRRHFRGSISMANAGPHTNGSQFFLTFVPTSFLDGRHTVFGRVVDGFEVLADIQRIDPEDTEGAIPEVDKIVTAKVLNKREHPYTPKKNANKR